MSSEYPSGEYDLLETDLGAGEVQAVMERLGSLRSRVECIEEDQGFVSVSLGGNIVLIVDRNGLELRIDVHLGNSILNAESAPNPEPESVIQGLAHIVQATPTLVSMGYERKSWGVDETSYVAQFNKALDISDLDRVCLEVETMIDFFADRNGTT
mgnify:CR=1 FL=1